MIDLMRMLSQQRVGEFFERGYLRLPGFFSQAEVEEMRQAFVRLERRAHELSHSQELDGALFIIERPRNLPLRIERIVWCGAAEPRLAAFGRSQNLLDIMAQLLGAPMFDQLINQAHIKRPGDGVAFSFHQDSYHRRYGTPLFQDLNGRGSFVQSLTAVDAMSAHNGGLWVLPESHRHGHLETTDGRLPESVVNPAQAVPVPLEAGDNLLLSPFIVHGSAPNSGSTPRRLFINGFCYPGANRRHYPGAGMGQRVQLADARALPQASDGVG